MPSNNNILNTQSQFPNIDQLNKSERGMFIKEHEFEVSLQTMVSELNSLLDTSSSSESAIEGQSAKVQAELNVLVGRIESEIVSLVERYIEQISDEIRQVEAAYERLYTKIYNIIQSINVNIQNRTTTYDIVMSYKLRILDEIEALFGKTSPYSDGRARLENETYSIQSTDTLIRLRDVDEGIAWRSFPVIIDPNITQNKVVKICEFTPIANGKSIPAFLAEVIVSGDLFAFKGILKSVTQDRDARFSNEENRSAEFVADYFINQDLPFALKVLYDEERNKIAVALKYDETDDGFTSIIKFDFSINLLVGTGLEFANESTCVIMDGAGLHAYDVTIVPGNKVINVGEYPKSVTHGGSIACYFESGAIVDIESEYIDDSELNPDDKLFLTYSFGNESIQNVTNYMFYKKFIDSVVIGNSVVLPEDISVVNDFERMESTIVVSNPERYAKKGFAVSAKVKLNSRFYITGGIKTTEVYGLPDLSLANFADYITIKVNGQNLSNSNWDFDNSSGLLQVNNITGKLDISLSGSVSVTSKEFNIDDEYIDAQDEEEISANSEE